MNGDSVPSFGGKPGEPVPAVDPEDLKKVWRLHDEIAQRHPGEQFATGASLIEKICKRGADIPAVGYRCGQLQMLRLISQQKEAPGEFKEKIAVLMKDGEFTDGAFRAMAKVPMEWMEPGVTREGPPYDLDQFLKLCAA